MNSRKCLSAVLCCLVGASSFMLPTAGSAQTSLTGQWNRLTNLPVSPSHKHMLPTGKVMLWGRGIAPRLWDPVSQAISQPPSPGYDVFCSGHSYLIDGQLFVAGGHIADNVGLAKASIYNAVTNTWTAVPDMNAGRWYPTVTTLANGDSLVVSGTIDTTRGVNALPQVYQAGTNTWRDLTSAPLNQPLYPRMFVAPNGKVIDVGPSQHSRILDTTGTGTWSAIGNRNFGWNDYGSAVMYAEGKILSMGGGDPPTATAEVIDLNVATPAWRSVAPMSVARRQLNATLLPDGTVLVTGGTSGPGWDNAAAAVYSAELWNPATEKWTTLASASVRRLYHSSAVLLPDGRVVTTGGDGIWDAEAFSPPYLFKGTRPSMSAVPTSIGYGQRFTVQSPNAAGITKVTLIRLSSVTHAFDQSQRMNILQFTPGTNVIEMTTPANANLAPPGHYMLFIVDSNGVPSIGSIVQLSASAPPPPPPPGPALALSSMSPSSATAGGPAFTLTVNGSNFASGATVRWNGTARSTTVVSGTQTTAAITAADIAAPGTAQVSVANPDGTTSNTLTFTVSSSDTAPAPALSSLSPSSATAGGPAFTLTVTGSNFVSGAAVRWNGTARPTTFVSGTQVSAAIPSTDIAAAGTANVSVTNPDGTTSGSLQFTISSAAAPAPALSSLSPSSATAGGPAFTLTVNGSNFVSGATVRWNGAARSTTFVSGTQVRAAIPSTDIATAGAANVSVSNPDGTASGALAFTVAAAGPTYSLTVTKTGAAASRGIITSDPAGINCGTKCSGTFAGGTSVTLTAKITGNAVFAGWAAGGACTGTAPSCTVTMDGNKSATATFNNRR